jgi:hypothetical protein
MPVILPGQVYRHWKGGSYFVAVVSRHEETGEELVTYRRTDGREYFTRALAVFTDEVQLGVKRFVRVR